MDSSVSLKDLMDPKRMELQARYNNAQIAVDLGYRMADKHGLKDHKLVVELARLYRTEIEKDLNGTLSVLGGDNGSESKSTKLS